ncbi:MAG TPA: carboxypeptidase-like regulatory domain-containing protein [Longimicrobium sp.]|nr:carboxypeptidase-like regulatory domain-containing protein [Longimicrobium sp.]
MNGFAIMTTADPDMSLPRVPGPATRIASALRRSRPDPPAIPCSLLPLPWLLALVLALLAPTPLSAQTVRGVLVDDAGRPVDGMVVGLYPAGGGRAAAGGLTDAEGRFSLSAPAPGRYLVRAERIGYRPAYAEVDVAAGETAELRLETAVRAFVLTPVEVTADTRCVVRPGAGMRAYELWQQAAVALRATELVEDQELVEYTVRTYRLNLHPTAYSRRHRDPPQRVRGQPFETLSPQELAAHGYMREEGDTVMFYGPDATVLLSDEFQDTHCLYEQERGRRGLVGVAFEPVEGRTAVDVRGTLWLDARTGELRRVEYEYTGMADGSRRSPSGGRVEFQRLPSGAWIVSRWHIRTTRVLTGRRRAPPSAEIIADVREAGGEVSEITVVEGAQP